MAGLPQGQHVGHLVQVRRSGGRKQSQEAAQSPGGGVREALLPAAAPGRPVPARVPWVPEPLSLPPGAGGGVLTVPGERAAVFLRPACVRGPGAPAAGRSEDPTHRGAAKPRHHSH